MRRTVYFEGELREILGAPITVNADTFQEALKCVSINRPQLIPYLATSEAIIHIGTEVEFSEYSTGDFYLSLVPEGSKGGGGKIAAAAALLALIVINPGSIFLGGTGHLAVPITKAGYIAASVATNLALTGIQQLLAPDPAVDREEPASYLFNGADQNIVEGDPVPLLYGELRVPGTPVSFEVVNRKFQRNNVSIDVDGNLLLSGV